MQTTSIVLVVASAIAVAAIILWLAARARRSEHLKKAFGGEYDRVIDAKGGRSRAEAELLAREKRVAAFDIHPLTTRDRDRFADRWKDTQAAFVDDPVGAVSRADALLEEVMRARGYPVAEFERRAEDLSVDHPRFVHNYREAHAIALAARSGTVRTEDLRRATIQYRDLFEDLLDAAA